MSNTSAVRADVAAAVDLLTEALRRLDPRDVPLPEVTSLWESFNRAGRVAATGEMTLADRVREADQWRRSGFRSPEEWMARKKGTSLGAARDQLAASKQLEALPDTAEALRSGVISPEQAVVVADAAAMNPQAEQDLIRRAQRDSHRGLRQEAARRKAQADPDPEAKARRHHRERRAWCCVDEEGRFNLQAQGPVSLGGAFQARLERETDRLFRAARAEGRHEPREAYMFDALMALADDTPEASRVAPKHLALIRVDLEALVRGRVQDEEVCEIGGLGPISVDEARALLGESILHLVTTKAQMVQSITHLGRGPNAVQELALLWQSQSCTVAGCHRTRTENDHRIEFSTTRHTRLDELDPLCDHHHDLKTYQGWALVHGVGERDIVPPDDPRHPTNTNLPPPSAAGGEAPPGSEPVTDALWERYRRAMARVDAGSRTDPEVAAFIARVNAYAGELE